MNISIIETRQSTLPEWDETWQQCSYATYFHSREWAEIWESYTHRKLSVNPIIIIFSDNKKAVLPLLLERNILGRKNIFISSAAGTYGGWISADGLTEGHAKCLVKYLTEELGKIVWRINPFDHLLKNFELTSCKNDYTYAINLNPGLEAIFKTWTKGHRSAVTKARREGINVKIAKTIEDWKDYYKVYQETLKRWGRKKTSQYNWRIFEYMYKQYSSNINLWLASYQNRIIAGALCLYAKTHVVYWHGAALEDYFHIRPTNFLIYKIIEDCCKKYTWFDFNPSGGHVGVSAFKKSFGTEKLYCPIVFNNS